MAAAGAADAGGGLECCACTPTNSSSSPTPAFFCIGPATITQVTAADEDCIHIPDSAFGCTSASGPGPSAPQLLQEEEIACPGAAAPAAGRPALLGLVGILGLVGALSLQLRRRRAA